MQDVVLVLLLLGLNLAFVSYLILARLGWQGVSGAKARWLVAELWGVFIIAVAIFGAFSMLLSGARPVREGKGLANMVVERRAASGLSEIGLRFSALPLWGRIVGVAAVLVAVGLLAHCLYSLNAAMRSRPEGNGEG